MPPLLSWVQSIVLIHSITAASKGRTAQPDPALLDKETRDRLVPLSCALSSVLEGDFFMSLLPHDKSQR